MSLPDSQNCRDVRRQKDQRNFNGYFSSNAPKPPSDDASPINYSDGPHTEVPRESNVASVNRPFTLRGILYLAIVFALMFAWWRIRHSIDVVEAYLTRTRPIARTLRIEDRSRIATINTHRLGSELDRLRLWVPPTDDNAGHELCLAIEDVPPDFKTAALPEPQASMVIRPGEHEIWLTTRSPPLTSDRHVIPTPGSDMTEPLETDVGPIVEVHSDHGTWLRHRCPFGWGYASTIMRSNARTTTESFPSERPVILFGRWYHAGVNGPFNPAAGLSPSDGILLWIRPRRSGKTTFTKPPASNLSPPGTKPGPSTSPTRSTDSVRGRGPFE